MNKNVKKEMLAYLNAQENGLNQTVIDLHSAIDYSKGVIKTNNVKLELTFKRLGEIKQAIKELEILNENTKE